MEFVHRRRLFVLEGYSPDDHIYRAIARTRIFYEADLLKYMRSLRLPLGLAVDVGANIGNHAVYFASFLAAHVLAIEPNAAVLPVLRTNLVRNCANFTISDKGLGEAPGRAEVALPAGADDNVGMARLRIEPEGGPVEVTTLDSLLREETRSAHVPVTLIKIDVEGMEFAVLRGGTETLRRHRPHLFIEITSEQAFAQIGSFLSDYGYVPVVAWGRTPVHHFAYRPSLFLRAHASVTRRGRTAWQGVRARIRRIDGKRSRRREHGRRD